MSAVDHSMPQFAPSLQGERTFGHRLTQTNTDFLTNRLDPNGLSLLQPVRITRFRHDSRSAVLREKAIGQRNVWQRNRNKVLRPYSSDNHSSDTSVHWACDPE